LLRAQNAQLKSNNESMSTQYCEDSYIELEVEITKVINGEGYIKFWIDGIPCHYVIYSDNDRFADENEVIIIGSSDCDV
jgi:hypothetical protein